MQFLRSLFGLFVFAVTTLVFAQDQVSISNQWWTYIADYDGTPGSIRIDMGMKKNALVAGLPFVVIAGMKYVTPLANGLPLPSELQRFNVISDKLILAVMALGPSVYVGTFTHKNEQEHFIYVKDINGVEAAFINALKRECDTCQALFKSKPDPEWNTYLQFLYPNQATIEYYRFDSGQSRTYRQ